MEFDLLFFAIAIPAVLFAGISKGGFGSAAAFAASPFLALILEPAQAVAIMLPLLIIMDFTAVRVYWKKWDTRIAKILIIGGVPGAIIGAVLVSIANPDVFRFLIGLIALGFVIFQIAKQRKWLKPSTKPISDRAGYLFGVGAGFTSFIAHAGGPVTSVYMLSQNLSKLDFQATTVVVFWISNLLKLALYLWLGFLSWDTALADLYLAPFAIIGRISAFG
ncbi:MAG: sulfite exporter TauE/SafE family protein [Pseudomonadota bacterium]